MTDRSGDSVSGTGRLQAILLRRLSENILQCIFVSRGWTMARRPGRPRAGQAPLTRERILAAAMRLADEQGIASLSMRRLAADLGVDPMAIYHHLPGKAAVV